MFLDVANYCGELIEEDLMSEKTTVVHVTHEAIAKIGGIGAVLKGLFTSHAYNEGVDRNILISPLFNTDGCISERLGDNSEVLYSSLDGKVDTNYVTHFRKIEDYFNVSIVYGRKTFVDGQNGVKSCPEVILIDISRMDDEPVNEFKKKLFNEFGIRSHLYEHLWEYEQYVRLAPVAIAALKAIGAAQHNNKTVIVSHEFMGMPTALAGILDPTYEFKTIFYAHEVATIRRIVESHPGHDTMFYNVMNAAFKENLFVNEVFGDQTNYFKHALVDAAKYCDNILCVGDHAAKELLFLSPEFEAANIDLAYNGIPAWQISIEEKLASREKLRSYCQELLGYKPDYIFTHVTRLVRSKGLWRDLRVLEHMESQFRQQNRTAVLLVLSTEVSRRRGSDIRRMESSYNWPVAHREGLPDLSGGEAAFYARVQEFNAKNRNIKVVFINQFGFSRENCGYRMSNDMEFMDIRKGSDVEFGQSIYEPFGIAQLEPLSFGGICVVSSVCGCAGFVKAVTNGEDTKNVIIADYTNLNGHHYDDIEDMLAINKGMRLETEARVSEIVARKICDGLANSEQEFEELICAGYELAKHMSWDVVVENYVLRGIQKALNKKAYRGIYISA